MVPPGYRWLEHPVFRFFGRISDSLYLYHIVVITSIEHFFPHLRLRWAYPRDNVRRIRLGGLRVLSVDRNNAFPRLRKRLEQQMARQRTDLQAREV